MPRRQFALLYFSLVTLCLMASFVISSTSQARPPSNRSRAAHTTPNGGSSSGGGGTVCIDPVLTKNQPVLADLIGSPLVSEDLPTNQDRLSIPRRGIEFVTASELESFKVAVHNLERWLDPRNPQHLFLPQNKVVIAIVRALSALRFVKVLCPLGPPLEFDSTMLPQCSNFSAIVYMIGNFAYMDVGLWNQTGAKSKPGLLIHEALRLIQGALHRHQNPVQWSNRDIQELTQMIVAGPSSPGASLYTDPRFAKFSPEFLTGLGGIFLDLNSYLDNQQNRISFAQILEQRPTMMIESPYITSLLNSLHWIERNFNACKLNTNN